MEARRKSEAVGPSESGHRKGITGDQKAATKESPLSIKARTRDRSGDQKDQLILHNV